MSYPHSIAFYAPPSGTTTDRRWVPSSTGVPVWQGLADVQDKAATLRRDTGGGTSYDFDAAVYVPESDEEEVLTSVHPGFAVTTPFGEGVVSGIRRLDGVIYIKYGRKE